jgi:hypothetical protein
LGGEDPNVESESEDSIHSSTNNSPTKKKRTHNGVGDYSPPVEMRGALPTYFSFIRLGHYYFFVREDTCANLKIALFEDSLLLTYDIPPPPHAIAETFHIDLPEYYQKVFLFTKTHTVYYSISNRTESSINKERNCAGLEVFDHSFKE